MHTTYVLGRSGLTSFVIECLVLTLIALDTNPNSSGHANRTPTTVSENKVDLQTPSTAISAIRIMTTGLDLSSVKGVLLDITGVLAESSSTGDGTAITGSVEAIQSLKQAGT